MSRNSTSDQTPVYTHGHHDSVLRSHNTRTVKDSAAYLEHELIAPRSLLDIGSGPGTITVDMARRLAPGTVTALETSDSALELTRQQALQAGVDNMAFVVGDVLALDFPDDHFDMVHAHQVLQHVSDPVQALSEMRRVCRPGGLVAVRDADYAGFVWYPALPVLDEWMRLYQLAARSNAGEPNAGRHLLSWALQAGFSAEQIECTSSTWCLATPERRQWWGGMWADRILHSRIATQLLESGAATQQDLDRISHAWRDWAQTKDGWMSMVHGEIICRV